MTQELIGSPLLITLVVSGFGVILIGIVFFLLPSATQSRLGQYVDDGSRAREGGPSQSSEQLGQIRTQLNTAFSILGSEKLRMQLASAHWSVSDAEYVLLRLGATFVGFILGWFISRSLLGGLGLGVLGYLVPGILLVRAIDRRQQKFQGQLLDALVLIKGAVQSGYSLLQSLDLARQELMAPASEEFGRVVREVQLGIPMNQALLNLSGRMQSDDLYMVVTSININSQVGGNLSTMLGAVSETIRARIYLFSEVRALTSYARYAGYFLSLLPFLTGLIIFFVNPGYFSKVPESIISQLILGLAFVLLLMGNFWLRQLVKIKI